MPRRNSMRVTGPSRFRLLLDLPSLVRDPLAVFLTWHERYGDTIVVPIRNPPTIHISNPEDIRHVLAVNPLNYRKTGALIIGRRVIGQGLLASGEPLHHQQRKIAQPHFGRQSVAAISQLMEKETADHIAMWQPGSVIDVFPDLARLTITIIGKVCFSTDLSNDSAQLYRDFGTCQEFMQKLVNIPDTYPTRLNRRYRAAVQRIDGIIDRLIDARVSMTERPADLLTTLLEAKNLSGHQLPRKQIRDEMVNILLAGHETTAIALSWTLYYLSINPEAERRFHEELSSVMKNNRGASGDIDRMPITEMILKESMRLRPPVWILGRVALEDDILPSGRPIPARTEVLMLPYIAHRNPTFFPDPESFIPERFSEERQQDLPPFVYFPFGGGPRGCMGETFARTEALIILAEVGKRFRLRLEPGHPVVPKPLVTLRPKDGIRMRVLPRDDFSLQDDSRSLAAEETRIRSRHQVA